jgi:hypothetical protein
VTRNMSSYSRHDFLIITFCGEREDKQPCTYYYIPFLNDQSFITDKYFVNQIDEWNRFPHQICVSHHPVHPITCIQGRIQDFKLGVFIHIEHISTFFSATIDGRNLIFGHNLKKLRRAEGGAKIFGVFRVKNHDFTPKKSYFFQF